MVRRARARMLSPSISVSERVNELPLKAALLYTWMLAHADDQGRMSGNPATIKATVVPMRRDISENEVEKLLLDLGEAGLIDYYKPDADETRGWYATGCVIQIRDWWSFQ